MTEHDYLIAIILVTIGLALLVIASLKKPTYPDLSGEAFVVALLCLLFSLAFL